ncbi:protein NYNRIN-like [Chenopodium quinoa]|uniref:protein NYNRIN-like n=1 Tax=Chenopodium quinoa TaxID=63459 RepID=UPI000B799130|nr:protein NYNRIN-like [Chenopodium quinoa]
MAMVSTSTPWYVDIANYLACGVVPLEFSSQQKKRFLKEVRRYFWNDQYLLKQCGDGLFRKCIPDHEIEGVLKHFHSLPYGGHGGVDKTVAKISQSLLWWPIMHRDAHKFVEQCGRCQRSGGITKRDEMPQQSILEVEPLEVRGVDYVTKWIEAIPSPINDHKVVLKLLKKIIFPRFGVPRVLISDEGSHFNKKQFEALLKRYGIYSQGWITLPLSNTRTSGGLEP